MLTAGPGQVIKSCARRLRHDLELLHDVRLQQNISRAGNAGGAEPVAVGKVDVDDGRANEAEDAGDSSSTSTAAIHSSLICQNTTGLSSE